MIVHFRGEKVECEIRNRHAYFADGTRARLAKTPEDVASGKCAVLMVGMVGVDFMYVAKIEKTTMFTSPKGYVFDLEDERIILKAELPQ